jgi:hydrogenase-1 operon protein HyaF
MINATPAKPMDSSTASSHTLPILHEIYHAVKRLLETGEETVLDLTNLPLGSTGQTELLEWLGTGEVTAQLKAWGESQIYETHTPGVWFIEHRNSEEKPLSKFIEVTYIPTILKAQPQDIQQGLEELTSRLTNVQPETQ